MTTHVNHGNPFAGINRAPNTRGDERKPLGGNRFLPIFSDCYVSPPAMLRTVWLFRNSRLTAEMEFLRTGISLWPTAHAGPECRQADNFGGLRFWADW